MQGILAKSCPWSFSLNALPFNPKRAKQLPAPCFQRKTLLYRAVRNDFSQGRFWGKGRIRICTQLSLFPKPVFLLLPHTQPFRPKSKKTNFGKERASRKWETPRTDNATILKLKTELVRLHGRKATSRMRHGSKPHPGLLVRTAQIPQPLIKSISKIK